MCMSQYTILTHEVCSISLVYTIIGLLFKMKIQVTRKHVVHACVYCQIEGNKHLNAIKIAIEMYNMYTKIM